jgi:hypothetical protein
MSSLTSDIQAVPADIFTSSTTAFAPVGAKAVTGDGREFRYVKAGAVALVPGKLQQSAAELTNHQNLAPTANVAIGATSFTVTLGATAATANYYAGGWAIITTSTGAGYQYQISSHPAADSAATLTIQLADPVLVAFVSASSKVDLVANPYSAIVVNPTTATSAPIGVAVYPVAASSYGWIQTKGPAAVLADGAVTVGTNVIASNAVAGAIEPGADAADLQGNVGIAITGIADTQYGAVLLNL